MPLDPQVELLLKQLETKRYKSLIHAAANMTGVLDGGCALVADVGAPLRTALHG